MRFVRRTLATLAVFFAASTLALHADTYATYNASGNLSPSGTYTGTFVLDQTNDWITDGSFSVTIASGTYSLAKAGSGGPASLNFSTPDSKVFLSFGILGTGTNPLPCDSSRGQNFTLYDLTSGFSVYHADGNGSITAATPEPSPLILLGSGILATAGAVRRRLCTA